MSKQHPGIAAARLARALAAVGLIAGSVVLWLFNRAIDRVSDTREQSVAATLLAQNLLDSFDNDRRSAAERIDAALDDREPYKVGIAGRASLDDELSRARGEAQTAAKLNIIQDCRGLLEVERAIARLEDQTTEWRRRHRDLRQASDDILAQADAALAALRGAADAAEGRQRLIRFAARRNFSEAKTEQDKTDALRVLIGQDDQAQVSAIKAELAGLNVLRDSLVHETDPDQLADIKDNRLSPLLTRIRAMLVRFSAGVAPADKLGPDLLTTFEKILFGDGYAFDADHQTVVIGRGGLFDISHRLAESSDENQRLREMFGTESARWRGIRSDIGARTSGEVEALSNRVESVLTSQRRSIISVSIIAAVFFVVLTSRIVRRLHHMVGDLQTANESLGEARTQAEAASRAKGEFLANMSHEIRTPMTAILGYSELLLDPTKAPAERVEFIATIRRNGEHLLSIINDILDLSKIEAGKMTVESVDCSPEQAVREVLSLMQVRVLGKELTLEADISPTLPVMVRSDPVRLRQILVNLVGNAIKFTHQGCIRIVCRGELSAKPGHVLLRFEVADTGIGMSPDQVSRLFAPFSQADCSTSRKYGGTGLGLTISRRLAKLMGGDLTVTSEVGHGSRFSLIFDAPKADAASVPPALRAPKAAPIADPEPLRGLRILLAEDGPDNQRLITHHLSKAGASVEVAPNGRIAVEMSSRGYALILMDMQMPELDGYAATSLLRQQGCTTPIIALTAHAMAEDRARCLAAGCDDYHSKPIVRDRLIALCRDWAGKQHSLRRAA